MWDIKTKELVLKINRNLLFNPSLQFSKNRKNLLTSAMASSSGGTYNYSSPFSGVYLWSLNDRNKDRFYKYNSCLDAIISEDENKILIAYNGKNIVQLDLETEIEDWHIRNIPGIITKLILSPEEQSLLVVNHHEPARIYDLMTRELKVELHQSFKRPNFASFSKDGKYAFLGCMVLIY